MAPALARRPRGRARLWPSDAIPLGDDARSRLCSGPPHACPAHPGVLPLVGRRASGRGAHASRTRLLARDPAPERARTADARRLGSLQALLEIVAPGRVVQGTALRDGRRLQYRINGWSAWWLTGGALGGLVGLAWALGDPAAALTVATVPAAAFGHLMSAANVVARALRVPVPPGPDTSGRRGGPDDRPCAPRLRHGDEPEPEDRGFDWKLFCEGRPGLIGGQCSICRSRRSSTRFTAWSRRPCWWCARSSSGTSPTTSTTRRRSSGRGTSGTRTSAGCCAGAISCGSVHLHAARALSGPAPPRHARVGGGGRGGPVPGGLRDHAGRERTEARLPAGPDGAPEVVGRAPRYVATRRGPLLLASGFWAWAAT